MKLPKPPEEEHKDIPVPTNESKELSLDPKNSFKG